MIVVTSLCHIIFWDDMAYVVDFLQYLATSIDLKMSLVKFLFTIRIQVLRLPTYHEIWVLLVTHIVLIIILEVWAVWVEILQLILLNLLYVNSWIAYLDYFVEVGQGLVLVHLGHTKLLNQKSLHILKLLDFLVHFLDLLMTFVYLCLIIDLLLVLDHPLTLQLHMDELSLAGVYFVSLLALFVVVVLFLAYSLFK